MSALVPPDSKAAGALMALLAMGCAFAMYAAANADTPQTMRNLKLNYIEESITRYTRDLGHLPSSLVALRVASSDEPGWRGPYALADSHSTLSVAYTIVDAATARYRIALAAKPLKSGELLPEIARERRVDFAGSNYLIRQSRAPAP